MIFGTTFEFVRSVGSFGGLASAIFIIYDRVVRGRPIIFLSPTKFGVVVCLKNVARETIIVDDFEITPVSTMGLAEADDLHSTIRAVAHSWYTAKPEKGRVFAVLGPEEARMFPLVTHADFDKASGTAKVVISSAWRNTRRPLPFARKVKITTTIGDLRELQKAVVTKANAGPEKDT